MRIQKIKISKFKSIYDELVIDFDKIDGFWKISGPVGAGKTTIGEAIIFGLFGTVGGKTNDSLISWGEKHGLVETWCNCKGHNIYIKREINKYGQSPIYVEIDGEELVFTNKRDGQQQLEQEYYDVTRTTLELLCIISFNNFKSLATLNASDTKKFLDQVLGFYTLTQYADACAELKKEFYAESSQLSTQMGINQSQINKILELASMVKVDGDLNVVQENIKKYEQERDNCLTEYDKLITEARSELSTEQAQLTKIKTLGANKKKEIDFIKKGVCPTCGAEIDQSQLKIKEDEREVLVEQYKAVSAKVNEKSENIRRLETIRTNKVKDYRDLIQHERALCTQLKEQDKRSKINTDEINKLNEQNKVLQKKLDKNQSEIEEWNELYTILAAHVRSKIMASFIPTLNKNILKYTQLLQQRYIIEFDPMFKCNIKICGMDDCVPLSSLSTGQLKTVNVCVILGVLGTIMGNVSFNVTFLDELFANLDADLRSLACSVLKQTLKPGQTAFVIAHNELESKYFDGEIISHLQHVNEVYMKSVYNISKNIQETT